MDLALPRHRRRSRPLIFLLVLLSVTLIAIDGKGDSGPIHAVRAAVTDGAAAVAGSVGHVWPLGHSSNASVRKLQNENAQLRAELAQTQEQLAQTGDAERQRSELTALLGLPTPNGVAKTIASITAIGASNFDDTIDINKGSDQNIAVGMPVVGGQGLIGRVIQVSKSHATVLLLQDTTFNVGIRFTTGDIGVGVGNGMTNPMRVDLIDLNSNVKVGDVAVTSGEDHSMFPPGIPVGTVTSVNAGPQDLRKNVQLKPIANIKSLSDVAVLHWSALP
jgi:rod shape-determining protein MreC